MLLLFTNVILCAICFTIGVVVFGYEFVCSAKFIVTLTMGGIYGLTYYFISDYIKQKVEYKQWLKDLKNERT